MSAYPVDLYCVLCLRWHQALMRPLRAMCDYQLDHGAVVHHSKQYLIDNGLYVKQLPKPTDVKRKSRRLVSAAPTDDEAANACVNDVSLSSVINS